MRPKYQSCLHLCHDNSDSDLYNDIYAYTDENPQIEIKKLNLDWSKTQFGLIWTLS